MKKECLTIIGTAHVSQESVDEVKEAIYEQEPEVVAIELDEERYKRLIEEKAGINTDEEISVSKIIKENKVELFITSALLTYLQSKIGEELDIKPGSEMIGAIEAAEDVGAKIALIDRNINITLQRTLNEMTFLEKLKFIFGVLASLITGGDEEEISVEELKQSDMLEEVMEYFKEMSPNAYKVLVKERDAYLSSSILNIPEDHVIAVVGAGHKEGINYYLEHPEEIPHRSTLLNVEKKGLPWFKIILAAIPITFILIFFLAFINGINIQGNLLDFILIGGGAAFLGSILSGSKIQSAVVGFIVAPLTIIHPLLAAGWFSGLTEAKFRKVKRSDIVNLSKIESLKDLWNNNIFRILLVVVGTNIGVSIATLLILPSRVFIPLIFKVFGA